MSYKMERKGRYAGKLGMQYKYFGLDTKEAAFDAKNRTISGYAAVFGNRDKAGDVLLKGCFAKSIRERGPESTANDKILMLWMHDMSEPIGKVVKLEEDDKGLYFEAKIDEIELGDRAINQLESGTLNQFSIGYSYVWENCEWEDDTNTLYVKEVKLYELSVVSIGCNAETEYLGLKSAEDYDEAYEKLERELQQACQHMSTTKQQRIMTIVAKAMSLAASRPEGVKTIPPGKRGADGGGRRENKSIFDKLKLKEV